MTDLEALRRQMARTEEEKKRLLDRKRALPGLEGAIWRAAEGLPSKWVHYPGKGTGSLKHPTPAQLERARLFHKLHKLHQLTTKPRK